MGANVKLYQVFFFVVFFPLRQVFLYLCINTCTKLFSSFRSPAALRFTPLDHTKLFILFIHLFVCRNCCTMPTLVSSLQPLMLLFSFSFHLFCPTELKMNASPSLFNMEKPQCWLVCFFGFVLGFFFFCCFGVFFVISFVCLLLVQCFVLWGGLFFCLLFFFGRGSTQHQKHINLPEDWGGRC